MEKECLRTAAYCRVSTDKEDQLHSLEAQRRFFAAYVAEREGWQLAGIYADEGLSGTAAERRPRFMEMVDRALLGEIDLIVTKEVSRFARNTVDALAITRRLKERGVGVVFLTDGIDTRDSDGEFRLAIMASVAQEESRKISQRTRWGQLQAMKRGVVFGGGDLYGYTLREGVLVIRPSQAEVVREIYRLCLEEGLGAGAIARRLTAAEIPPPRRCWSAQTVLGILHNEKYCGDLVQKKSRTADYLTHRRTVNRGEEEQVRLMDHHPAVVGRDVFRAVQRELKRRAGLRGEGRRHAGSHWYSGKLRCGLCGRSLTAKRTLRRDGTAYLRFVCRGRGDGCPLPGINGMLVLACVQYAVGCLPLCRRRILAEALGTPWRDPLAEERALGRLEDRRRRAVEAYLAGRIVLEELEREEADCRRAAAELTAEADRPERALSPMPEGLEALLEQAVLAEAVEEITAEPGALLVRLRELPGVLRMEAEVQGAGGVSRGKVTSCRLLMDKGSRYCRREGKICI